MVQLTDVVPATSIFDEYLYLSSASKALRNHFKDLVGYVSERFHLNKEDVVVDVGCNDGILLNEYSDGEIVRIGVEPSKVAEIARKSGLIVIEDFFTRDVARNICNKYGHPKIITATNVFVHVDNMDEFIGSFEVLLEDEGVLIIEASYLIDLIDKVIFDTIYHEHLCYLSLTPLVKFLESYDIEVFDVTRLNFGASGPSIRVFMQKKGGKEQISDNVQSTLEMEKEWGVGNIETYRLFHSKVETLKKKLLGVIEEIIADGSTIAGYGAPAKGNTLLNFLGITQHHIKFVAETNEIKQGMLTPGSHLPIVSEEELLRLMPEYSLLLAWNYLDFFIDNSEYYKKGGKFIVPIPDPRIV
ncbi:MAG: methyltransferase domain-containing protein [Gammaproteobacteria bacterium]|nr:methyltransferase domain-containing protein [Gammaproteobacteria bacterium]